ncbi:hypothetical protein MNEG_0012 [Monoraphidium neglectum]|uniref:Peptidase A1 domain-containing protein n=1 Tax=Monoraphidium neglectum TaxID=145388 RepID=A0A0D2LNS9_9CHLO|nr:hypothetical protein MNEG_0012 [Monoraphidium neglectum]KIZ07939.1 hypothetical protein MNEG_0012 [Monoraphidium neglectum]|eukprot:XP_013906958.1 hypothetical protein MNEG_0012 [Monoraphidium neglectum]
MAQCARAEHSSSEGWLVLDRFHFPDGSTPVEVTFGCGMRETGEIYRQAADGILGMGNNANALHSQLARAGITSRVFSLCFGFPAGGTLLLGDVGLPPSVGPLSFTPLLASPTPYYVVRLEQLSIGGASLNLEPAIFAKGYGTVLDSGTTFSYLPTAAFAAFTAALDAAIVGRGMRKGSGPDPAYPDVCYSGAPEKFEDAAKMFPTASLRFAGGAVLSLPPHRYLFLMGRGEYCLGVFDNGQSGTLIGGIAVRNALVLYDLERQRIGFAEADCPNLGSAVAAAAAAEPVSPGCRDTH